MTGPRRAAVLGHPIAHSLSPLLHRAAYAELGLDWEYRAIDVTEAQLPGVVAGLDDTWVGLSLTMPLKEAVLPLLDQVEPLAAAVAAVNTVVLADGHRHGSNTDVTGLRQLLRDAGLAPGVRALVLGAGATARSAVAALVGPGADLEVAEVGVAARRAEASQRLCARLAGLSGPAGGVPPVAPAPWPPEPEGWDVVVSTVPAAALASLAPPGRPGLLVDVIYHPWPTPLASAWARAGGAVVGGLELLVGQAVEQVALMTGRRPDPARLRAAGAAELDARRFAQAEQ